MSETTADNLLILKENETIASCFSIEILIRTLKNMIKKIEDETTKLDTEFEAKKLIRIRERETLVKAILDSGIIQRFNAAKKEAYSKARKEAYIARCNTFGRITRLMNPSFFKELKQAYDSDMDRINNTVYVRFDEKTKLFKYDDGDGSGFDDYVKKELGLDWVYTTIQRIIVTTSILDIQALIDKIECYSSTVVPVSEVNISFKLEYQSIKVDLFPG